MMLEVLSVLALCGIPLGILLLVPKRTRSTGKAITAISIVSLVILIWQISSRIEESAIAEGWANDKEKTAAAKAGVTSPALWKAEQYKEKQAEIEKQLKVEAAVKAEEILKDRVRAEKLAYREKLLAQSKLQTDFIKTVENIVREYGDTDTDFQKGALRPKRAALICNLLVKKGIDDWVGEITDLTTNQDGKGVAEIRISQNISIITWNNEFSDINYRTMINPGSKLYDAMFHLKEGEHVRFSGTFFSDKTDCIKEGSVTLSGSMKEPEFIFRFSKISPIPGLDASK